MRNHVLPGSLVFTDAYTGYRWLAKKDSGYVHRCVNHKQKEFSRAEEIFGVRQVVTSNTAVLDRLALLQHISSLF